MKVNIGQLSRSKTVYRSANAIPNVIAKVPNFVLACVADADASFVREPSVRENRCGYIQGLRHDPTPRKSLATWPTTKPYHTLTATKTVSHLRMAASSGDNGCRQKYQ